MLTGGHGFAGTPTLLRRGCQFDAYCHLAHGVLLRQE
jgi:hypothetical protein